MAGYYRSSSLFLVIVLYLGFLVHGQILSPRQLPKSPKSSAINKPEPLTSSTNDEFFKAPDGIERVALGTILRTRKVPNPISVMKGLPVKPAAAHQILYRTQDSMGKPGANVVTVLVPYNAKKKNLFVLSYFSVSLQTF
jgi:hypothetical protein